MAKWFDFGSVAQPQLVSRGSKFILRLSFTGEPDPTQLDRAFAAGWVRPAEGADGRIFEHLSDVRTVEQAASCFEAFFGRKMVRESMVDIEALSAKIEPPSDGPKYTQEQILAGLSSAGAPVEFAERVKKVIQQSQELVGARINAQRIDLFNGDGFGVFERLSERVGVGNAVEQFGAVLVSIARQRDDWQEMHGALMEADGGGPVPSFELPPAAASFVEDARKVIGIANGFDFAKVDEARALRGNIIMAFASGRVGYRAYDGSTVKGLSSTEMYGNLFRAQPGISQDAAKDIRVRVSQALRASAAVFGVEPSTLFAGAAVQFASALSVSRTDASMEGAALTRQVNTKTGTVAAHAIVFSPNQPGALIHEIGHQVHGGNRAAEKEILEAVKKHEFARHTRRLISEIEASGLMTPEHAEYLMKPEEIFARAFSEFVQNHAPGASSGGALCGVGEPSLTPVGPMLESFMADMKTVVLDMRADAERAKTFTAETPAPSVAGMAM